VDSVMSLGMMAGVFFGNLDRPFTSLLPPTKNGPTHAHRVDPPKSCRLLASLAKNTDDWTLSPALDKPCFLVLFAYRTLSVALAKPTFTQDRTVPTCNMGGFVVSSHLSGIDLLWLYLFFFSVDGD